MTDVKRLLEAASPLPWRWESGDWEKWHLPPLLPADSTGETDWNHPPVLIVSGYEFDVEWRNPEADAALIVAAVNRLPDYEAAVDALERLLDLSTLRIGRMDERYELMEDHEEVAIDLARVALTRLREI